MGQVFSGNSGSSSNSRLSSYNMGGGFLRTVIKYDRDDMKIADGGVLTLMEIYEINYLNEDM